MDSNSVAAVFPAVALALQSQGNRPGAQTKRRGDTRPVRGLLGGKASPAAVILFQDGMSHTDEQVKTNAVYHTDSSA